VDVPADQPFAPWIEELAHEAITGGCASQPPRYCPDAAVTRGETALTLTPREYGVLEFLLRHKGDVVTKSEILRSVWDANYEGDDNVVEVYIGYLRRKVDVPFGVATIETVRGAGYRLLTEAQP